MTYSLGGEIMGCLKIYNNEYTRIKQKMAKNNSNNNPPSDNFDYDKFAEKLAEQLNSKKKSFFKIDSLSDLLNILAIIVPIFISAAIIIKNVDDLKKTMNF